MQYALKKVNFPIKNEKFNIFSVKTIDEGMELLTGMAMGTRDENGEYPEGTLNYLIEEKLERFASIRKQYTSLKSNGKSED